MDRKHYQAIVDNPEHFSEKEVTEAKALLSQRSNASTKIQGEWFYAWKGSRIGPVSADKIVQKIEEGFIKDNTLIWTTDFPEWKPAGITCFHDVIHPPRDPSELPSLPTSAINNTYIWILAFAPLILTVIGIIIYPLGEMNNLGLWIALGVNGLLCKLDETSLKNAGYNPPSAWWLFLVPVYIFLRSKRLNHKYSYLVVWWIVFFFSLLIDMIFYAGMELGEW